MKYGERLKQARKHAGITQADLSTRIGNGLTQAGISYLEKSDATGSEFTVQFAKACGINPDWLATEEGEMVDGLYVHDERIKRGVEMLEQLKAEYRLDDALDFLNSAVKLARKKNEQ